MNIFKQRLNFFNKTLEVVPKRLKKLYWFGYWALSGEHINSIRGNARGFFTNYHTAKTKAWRLLDKPWEQIFVKLLVELRLVSGSSVVVIDFSDFKGWQVLMFAIQTKDGRAIPVYFEVIKYPIQKDSQNTFIINAIEHFIKLVGCRPMVVMDRGFACPSIIRHLANHGHLFVIRVKGIKQFNKPNQRRKTKAKNMKVKDQMVEGYDRLVRLVVSEKSQGVKESWYLITNDLTRTWEEIIKIYYHRFEIEEFFKDAKWLAGLEKTRFKKQKSIEAVIWFTILGIWFAEGIRRQIGGNIFFKRGEELSFNRVIFESLQRGKNFLLMRFLGSLAKPLYLSSK